jgi:hypothetical protein
MIIGDRPANPVLIVIAVGGKGSNGVGDLAEQRASRRSIVDFPILVTSTATISPLSASTPKCSLRQDRPRDVPCFSTSHSPAPPSLRPVLSTSRCSGPEPLRRSGGTSSALARRLNVK